MLVIKPVVVHSKSVEEEKYTTILLIFFKLLLLGNTFHWILTNYALLEQKN